MAYTAINIEGGMFPPDLLDEIAQGEGVHGQRPGDFALGVNQRVTDEIQASFSDSRVFWDAFQRTLTRASRNSTTITRQNWMVPLMGNVLGFDQLAFQQGSAEAGGQMFNISHRQGDHSNATPIHIVSFESDLDRRNGARRSPHALIQEYLNSSDALWGLVSNGKTIRLLRDSARLTKPTFIEFDLGGMVESNLYNEFSLFYRLTHVTRFPNNPEKPQECLLEDYYQQGINQGTRIRDKLRLGVENALRTLGAAFIAHPGSSELRARIDSGELSAQQFYRQLLCFIYRLVFLMVAEERRLLFPDNIAGGSRHSIYRDYYSVEQLRKRADRYFHGDDSTDLWQGLNQTFRLFRTDDTAVSLGLSALNGELFGERACSDLEGATCTNQELLRAVRQLSVFRNEKDIPTRVNYADLDVEELGSVYESLLEFQPILRVKPHSFELTHGGDRRKTGSYYTPSKLVDEVINSALVPVIDDRVSKATTERDKEDALLGIRVCDPAAGSGHFILAAARRIARTLAQVRTGESEPAPVAVRQALRDVIRNCIYAVEKNPLAVDLCKVALWIEGHHAGLPLSFLDHHVKNGDSLKGVFELESVYQGIPDAAFKPVPGDDKTLTAAYLKRNKSERSGQLPFPTDLLGIPNAIVEEFEALATLEERTPGDVQAKEDLYASMRGQETSWGKMKLACDLWVSAFVTPKDRTSNDLDGNIPTTGAVYFSITDPRTISKQLSEAATHVSTSQKFFHWPLEFPEVFQNGGFDCVVTNPPWEKVKIEEKEFFAARLPEISEIDGRLFKKDKRYRSEKISELEATRPQLYREFQDAKYSEKSDGKFFAGSGRYPMTARREINLYSIFTELAFNLINDRGMVGTIIPSGIVTDETGRYFFGELINRKSVSEVTMFDYRSNAFVGVNKHFCLITFSRAQMKAEGGFKLRSELIELSDLLDKQRQVSITADQVRRVNPNTLTCPILRCQEDADILYRIYENMGVLLPESPPTNPWLIDERRFQRMFDMTNDRSLHFRTWDELQAEGGEIIGHEVYLESKTYLPLYEGKMFNLFDSRWGTYESKGLNGIKIRDVTDSEKNNGNFQIIPQYWVQEDKVQSRTHPGLTWQIGIREISNTTNERTLICAALPCAAFGNKIPLIRMPELHPVLRLGWLGLASSLALDFASRQKLGALTFNQFYLKQLPFPNPEQLLNPCPWEPDQQLAQWIAPRVLELSYTNHELKGMANELGYTGAPFNWDTDRRDQLRKELDAACFIIYGISPNEAEYIMANTFPILRKADERKNQGEFRLAEEVTDLMRSYLDGVSSENWKMKPIADGWIPDSLEGVRSKWVVKG